MFDAPTFIVTTPDDARLCAQSFGDEAAPAIVLVGGATWSMDWWEDELCRRIAARGRRVIRYDARDTGESTSYPVGAPADIPVRTLQRMSSRSSITWGS